MVRESERALLTNLSVLSKLRPQDRLNVRGGMLFIVSAQTPIRVSGVFRVVTGNGRDCTIQSIARLFEEAIEMWYRLAGEGRSTDRLRGYVRGALVGLNHLVDVYATDSTAVSRIEVVSTRLASVVGCPNSPTHPEFRTFAERRSSERAFGASAAALAAPSPPPG